MVPRAAWEHTEKGKGSAIHLQHFSAQGLDIVAASESLTSKDKEVASLWQ